tara:strand:+ start:1473 stop:1925 length:453 start_codon:yes stop_codon:yes gene_type:complete
MAFSIRATLQAMQSFLSAGGYSGAAVIGEPKSPPTERLTASIFMASMSVAELTLTKTRELHVVTVRLYINMMMEPTEDIEGEMADAIQLFGEQLLGDFDLGATIQNIDAGGIFGTALSATWGFLDLGGTMYRIADITVPLIVNDSATTTA